MSGNTFYIDAINILLQNCIHNFESGLWKGPFPSPDLWGYFPSIIAYFYVQSSQILALYYFAWGKTTRTTGLYAEPKL